MSGRGDGPGEAAAGRIVVVEDEDYLGDLLLMSLGYEGFEVRREAAGLPGLRTVVDFRPDLVVLDVVLPDIDGLEVCRRLRRDGFDVPVLFLTARDEVADRVRGLTVGGDDYLTKPFSLEELVARVRAVLRRTRPAGSDERLRYADLVLDEATHEARRGERPLELTATEFNIVRYLLANAERVLSKEQILDHVWQYDFSGNPNIIETYISYIRKKVDRQPPPRSPPCSPPGESPSRSE